jgi:ATP-binding cassette subfamily F protein uup
VVTSTLVFSGEGKIEEVVGGYDDWQQQRKTALRPAEEKSPRKPSTKVRTATGKITFKEEKELEALPEKIRTLEAEKKQIYLKLADPDFYRSNDGDVSTVNSRLQALENELAEAYMRWEYLEERKGQALATKN